MGLIDRCIKITTRQATREELLSKHTAQHIDLLKKSEDYSDDKLEHMSSKYDSVYIHPVCFIQINRILIVNNTKYFEIGGKMAKCRVNSTFQIFKVGQKTQIHTCIFKIFKH